VELLNDCLGLLQGFRVDSALALEISRHCSELSIVNFIIFYLFPEISFYLLQDLVLCHLLLELALESFRYQLQLFDLVNVSLDIWPSATSAHARVIAAVPQSMELLLRWWYLRCGLVQ